MARHQAAPLFSSLRLPNSANADSIGSASAGFYFRARAGRTEHQVPLSIRTDSNQTVRFVALAIEQLALVTNDRFHINGVNEF
jgi:hypothetical protein